MKVLGLDEAGRGCVLGPLVVGGYCIDEAGVPGLKRAGATDSKKLSAKKRESLIDALDALGEWELIFIEPREIDAGNINTLEEEAFVQLIRRFRPDRVIIDAPVHPKGIPNFERRLRGQLDYGPELVIEPKADLNHPPCGAASIFAKVHRDARIHALGEVGSGYPSDPKTRAWLQGFVDRDEAFPASVRTRWGTVREMLQKSLF
jgi:ribonuclease HII